MAPPPAPKSASTAPPVQASECWSESLPCLSRIFRKNRYTLFRIMLQVLRARIFFNMAVAFAPALASPLPPTGQIVSNAQKCALLALPP